MEKIKNKIKKIPKFKNEDEERVFWDTHNSEDYFDFSNAKRVVFPNLKPSTQSISLRLPVHMIESLKNIAHNKDVPYQSLIKIFLDEKIHQELRR